MSRFLDMRSFIKPNCNHKTHQRSHYQPRLPHQITSSFKTPSTTDMYNSAAVYLLAAHTCNTLRPRGDEAGSLIIKHDRSSQNNMQAHAGNLRVMSCFPRTAVRTWKAPKTWSDRLECPSTKTYRPTCYAYLGSSWMKSSKHMACQPWIYFIFPPHKTLAEKRAFAVMPRCCRPNSFAKSRPNSSVSSWSAEDGEVPHIRKSRRHWALGARLA